MEPLKFELTRYIVNKEEDFTEDGVDKIRTYITVCIGTVGSTNNMPPEMTRDLEVINLNSQTGEEMDTQRYNECLSYVQNNFNTLSLSGVI